MKKVRLKLWGVRGSSPVSGKDFLQFGGESTCYEIETPKVRIIIDAGSGIRALGLQLTQEKTPKPLHLFLTHYHLDHICGLPHFKPLFLQKYPITLHLPKFSHKNPYKTLENFISPPIFPKLLSKSPANIKTHTVTEQIFHIGDVKILPMKMHHPNGAMGYKFIFSSGKTICIVSDNEILEKNLKKLSEWCKNSDLLIHDAQYTKEEYQNKIGWGHSSMGNLVTLSKMAHVKKVFFSHHDPVRTDLEFKKVQKNISKFINNYNDIIECQFARQFDEFFV